ncbi:MAG: DUF1499 domain-containing protein [Gammaproteobacteria bacterium]|nr:DUF1499 domain-containing protein [Gammaproteobacteria bacterium]
MTTLALVTAIATVIILLMATMGFRMEWWGYSGSLTVLRVAVSVGVIAMLLAVIGIFKSWTGRGRPGLARGVIALLIVAPTLVTPLYWSYSKSTLPPIQDISTDLESPPEFWDSPTSRIYPGEAVAKQQREAFPDIQPLFLSSPMTPLFDQILTLVRERGWTLVAAERDEGRIEATVTTFWYGFKDDVVFRLTQLDAEVRVDMRSTSRFGSGGDGGSNAQRIRAFLAELKQRMAH